jgi:hypothetical protein
MSKTSSLSERLRSLSEDLTIDLTETTVKYPIQKNTSHQKNDGDETKQQGAQQRKSLSIDKAAKVCRSEDQNF